MPKKTLFVDMDGTLSRFYEKAKCIENCTEDGFFLSLKPYANVLSAINILHQRKKINLIFLSAVMAEDNKAEKVEWLRRNLSGFSDRDIRCMFPHCSCDKPSFVKKNLVNGEVMKELNHDLILLDDYSKNLMDWKQAGGIGVKLLNDVNNRGWHGIGWNGPAVSYEYNPAEIADYLERVCLHS